MVAALKFRFNYCEGKNFDFSRLIKDAEPGRKRPHRALPKNDLNAIFNKLKPYPTMHVACRILLDLAARVQDLVQFKFNSFKKDNYGQGTYQWVSHKTG